MKKTEIEKITFSDWDLAETLETHEERKGHPGSDS